MRDSTSSPVLAKPASQRPGAAAVKPRRKQRWWIPLLIIAILVISGLVAATATRDAGSSGPDGGTFTARRSDLTITVTEGGSIRAHKSVEYRCQVESRGVQVSIVEIVPPGTYVTQEDVENGMVLVKLDSSQLEDQVVQERMELSGDRQNATSEKEAYDIQVIQNESDIAAGELRVRFALMDLQKYLGAELAAKLTTDVNEAGNLSAHVAPFLEEARRDPNILAGSAASQELKRFQDDIVLAEGNLRTAEATLAGTERLHDANYVSDLDLQRDRLTVTNRRFSEENARVGLDLFWRYDFPKSAEQYLSDYIETRRDLERIYAQCRSRLLQAEARLANAQERLHSQESRVNELEQLIEYCTIRAKAPGLVIYGTGGREDSFRAMRGRGGGGGGGIIAEGEVVYEGQTLLSMPDMASMVAEIGVHETEVDKVRPGQPATIVMDAFPDQILEGTVLEVAPLPDQQRGWMNPDLKVYETLVSINGSHDFLKSRMSCRVEVLVRRLNDVIVVPIQVVANRQGRKVVYVYTGSGSEEREVQTGAFNDTFVQIVSGLEEGDEVLLNPPLYTETAASTFENRTIPTSTVDANDTSATPGADGLPAEMPGQTGGRRGRRGGEGMPDFGSMTEEQRQQMRQRFQQMGGGQGMPDFGNMTEEQRQQMRERFQQMGGGEGMPDFGSMTEEQRQQMRQRFQQMGGGQGMPDLSNMTEEQRQQMRERFQQMGGRGGRTGAGGMDGGGSQRTRGQRRSRDADGSTESDTPTDGSM